METKNFVKIILSINGLLLFPREKSGQLGTCFPIGKGRYISFGHDNNIMFGGKQAFIEAKKFSDQSFYSVSFCRVSRFLGYGNSQPLSPLCIDAYYDRKMTGTFPLPLFINCFVSASIGYPLRLLERLFFHVLCPDHPDGC